MLINLWDLKHVFVVAKNEFKDYGYHNRFGTKLV